MKLKIGVAGAGLMGSGIAGAAAQAGHEVRLLDVGDDLVAAGLDRIEKQLARAVEKGKLQESAAEKARALVHGANSRAELAGSDLVIEAITERIDAKNELFRELDAHCAPECIFASNTSSLSITEMAVASGRPDRFCGLHFFNPVSAMKLVELIHAPQSSPRTLQLAREFGESLGKTVIAAGDTPGFVVNRLLTPYLLDGIRSLEDGIASREDIDAGMKLGCGHPMGPLTLADYVGLDTMLHIAGIMFAAFDDPKFAAPPLLVRMVERGHLGRKSGRGFYEYD